MKNDKIQINLSDFPPRLHAILTDTAVYDCSCSSDAVTLRTESGLFIKTDEISRLKREAEMTKHFHSLGLGVEVLDYFTADKDYLVTRAAEGQDLTHFTDDPKQLCTLMADSMRFLHSLPVCTALSIRHERYLDSASGSISGGYYDESTQMEKYKISSRQEAWDIMQANKHLLRPDTLIHGDFCLPNLIANDYRLSAFIDLGMAGAGDRHVDIYWALWSLQYNLKTDKYSDYFLDAYGRANFEDEMLRVVAAFELFG